jgi:gliding motility-associated-like protein
MGNSFNNIDEAFKNAFQHAEAPFSPSDLHADWTKVSNQIPQTPAPHNPAPHIGPQAGLGKIIGFSGIGAAVIATVVILYSIYVKPVHKDTVSNKPVAEKQVIMNQNPGTDQNNPSKQPGTIALNNGNAFTGADKGKTGYATRDNNPQVQTTPGTSPTVNNPVQDNPPFYLNNNNGSSDNSIKPKKPLVQLLTLDLAAYTLCAGQPVTAMVNGNSAPVFVNWGDGLTSTGSGNINHTYINGGKFYIEVSDGHSTANRTVSVAAKPKARFTAFQFDKLKCKFSNKSTQASAYTWIFGDGSAEEHGYNAEDHTYPDTGRYLVRLVATNAGGCNDTFSQLITVSNIPEPQVSFQAITPNGDGIHDDFYVNIQDETYFMLTIVDRTGQIVFQASDKNRHWDGKNQKTGADSPEGSYYYSVTYSYKNNGEPRTIQGAIYLKR